MYSIETRHPFLDSQLVEFCLALPWSASFHRWKTKIVLRDAMNGFLPEEILNSVYCHNPGRYFIKEMFRVKKDYFDYLVNYQLDDIKDYVNLHTVKEYYERCQVDWKPEEAKFAFLALNLAAWMQRN